VSAVCIDLHAFRDLPLHHKWIFLLHGELRVYLNGIVFLLQLQQLLPALLRDQFAVIDDIYAEKKGQKHKKEI